MFHLYGFFIGLAIVTGWSIAERIEPRVNKIAIPLAISSLIGARIWYVASMWGYYSQNISQIWQVWNGGMSIWGSLLAGSICIWLYFKGSSLKVLAAIVMGLPLAQAIGRIGNGVNHEFVQRVWILPWWGAEAILDLVLFGLLWSMKTTSPKVRVMIYLLGYGLIRYILQPYRA